MEGKHAVLDDVYERLHKTGPEFRGWLSNHGPMAAEALIRHGHQGGVHRWLDRYVRRLEPFPAPARPIGADWAEALGDVRRVADWTAYFQAQLNEPSWREVLNRWWPRLLPGIAAGATHGVIRVGHAVRVLLEDGETPRRRLELAMGLAYWAARWNPVVLPEGANEPTAPVPPMMTVADALSALPRLGNPEGGLDAWVGRMQTVPGWIEAVRGPRLPEEQDQVAAWLDDVVDEALTHYLAYAHGDPIMLVHAVTAPTAVRRVLPALDGVWWKPSAAAAWAAVATLGALYTPDHPAYAPSESWAGSTRDPSGVFARAAEHGDEHVIKLADAAWDAFQRAGKPEALAAVERAASLIRPQGDDE